MSFLQENVQQKCYLKRHNYTFQQMRNNNSPVESYRLQHYHYYYDCNHYYIFCWLNATLRYGGTYGRRGRTHAIVLNSINHS